MNIVLYIDTYIQVTTFKRTIYTMMHQQYKVKLF